MPHRVVRQALWGAAAGSAATLLVAMLGLAGWVLVTYVRVPEEPYATTPDPCSLVSEDTLTTLVGDVPAERSRPSERSDLSVRPHAFDAGEVLRCVWEKDRRDPFAGRLRVDVERYDNAGSGFAETGVERASNALTRDLCTDERPTDRGTVCVTQPDLPIMRLQIVQGNLVVDISYTAPGEYGGPADPAALLVDEVRTRLDERGG